MNRSTIVHALAALSLSLVATGCESVSSGSLFDGKKKDGLVQVDELLTRVEQLHVETELSKERVRESMEALRAIVSPEFGGDAVETYKAFTAAIEASEKQAEKLTDAFKPMEKTADKVFSDWARSLESFSNAEMRDHSQMRLEETRERYEAIVSSTEPAMWAYEAHNRSLRDHALFLGHDFNATAVSELQGEVDGLLKHASQLDKRFDAVLKAAKRYVQSTALRGQVEGEEAEPAN